MLQPMQSGGEMIMDHCYSLLHSSKPELHNNNLNVLPKYGTEGVAYHLA